MISYTSARLFSSTNHHAIISSGWLRHCPHEHPTTCFQLQLVIVLFAAAAARMTMQVRSLRQDASVTCVCPGSEDNDGTMQVRSLRLDAPVICICPDVDYFIVGESCMCVGATHAAIGLELNL